MNRYLPVLIVEDSEDDATLLVQELKRAGYEVFFERVWNGRQMTDALRRTAWDLIISDYSLPGFNALDALAVLRASELDIPFILLSGTIGEETAAAAMKAGASDYILKGNTARLSSAIDRELREARERAGRREAERALRESEDRLRQMAENVDQAFWLIDARKKQVLYASPACRTILGDSKDLLDCRLRPWKALHPEDRERLTDPSRIRPSTSSCEEVYRIVDSDGSIRWIRERTFPIQSLAGEIWRVVGTAEDITERKELEERLRQAQKMDAIGQLAGGIAHDFNNILCVVQGYASMLEGTPALDDEGREAVREITLAAQRATALTRQLLTISRNQIFQFATIDLNAAVRNMSTMLQRTLGDDVTLEVKEHSALPPIRADAGMIDQILLNLGVNARDAMPQGGRLTITTEVVNLLPTDTLGPDQRPGQFVRLTVADTGCGIPSEHLSRIFEPFFTTKAQGKGTGLGLAIVYGIVKQHQGWIDLRSEPGRGSAFCVYLPTTSHTAPEPRPLRARRDRHPTETLLVVEDDAAVRELTRSSLAREGYRVLEAPTARAALEVWGSHGGKIDLLLTDVVMPNGMTGLELADRLTREKPSLRVLFVSGYPDARLSDSFARDHLLRKPYTPEQLAAQIRETLDRPAVPITGSGAALVRTEKLRVLLIDEDPATRQLAAGMLKWHGHELDVATNGFEAISTLRRRRFDLLLIDATLSAKDNHEVVRRIREALPPTEQPWIAALGEERTTNWRQGCLQAGADDCVARPLRFDRLRDLLEHRRARPAAPMPEARAS